RALRAGALRRRAGVAQLVRQLRRAAGPGLAGKQVAGDPVDGIFERVAAADLTPSTIFRAVAGDGAVEAGPAGVTAAVVLRAVIVEATVCRRGALGVGCAFAVAGDHARLAAVTRAGSPADRAASAGSPGASTRSAMAKLLRFRLRVD